MSTNLRTRPLPAASIGRPRAVRESHASPARPPRGRRRSDVAASTVARLISWALRLVACALLSFAISSLLGHSQMESARREMIRAKERAQLARLATAQLRRQVDRLSSMRALDQWARSRGFVLTAVDPFDAREGSEYVVRR